MQVTLPQRRRGHRRCEKRMLRRLTPLLFVALALLAAVSPAARADRAEGSLFEAPRELLNNDDALRARTLDEIQGFGVTWVRVVLYWRNVAPNPADWRVPGVDLSAPGTYDWAPYDRAIDELHARNLKVLLTVSGPVPNWASRSRHSATMHPSAAQFARFMRAAGSHYATRISHWSIWNEPNHPDFLGPQYSRGHPVSPRIYRALFLAGERGLKASGNGGDVVLMGETAPVGTSHVVPPLTFLRGALCLDSHYHRRGSCGRLGADGYAHHAYTHGTPWYRPRSRNDVTIGVLGRLNHALALARRAGAIRPPMPIWLTEFGIQSKPDPFIGVGEIAQAEYRSIAELLAYRNPRVRVFSQYLMRDDRPRPGPQRQRYSGFESGLRHSDGTVKRSYEGYRLALVAKRGTHRVFLWGVVRPHHGRDLLTLEYRSRNGKHWRTLKRDRTNAHGVWSTTTPYLPGRVYRVAWRGRHGPPTRVFSRI